MTTIKWLGVSGLIASILVGFGEFYLHYSPNVLAHKEAFEFFQDVSKTHLTIGHWLIIIGIPFYFGGYLHIYKMLQSGSEFFARIVLFLGFLAFTVGGIWISSRAMIGNIVHLKNDMPLHTFNFLIETYGSMYEVLVQILRINMALLSIAFAFSILKFKTKYPQWMAFFNPITILLVFVFFGFLFPSIGKYTLPILMNITHFVLFSISLYILNKKQTI